MPLPVQDNHKPLQSFAARLGPGLITGAADDDPSGIATYSQAGSQFRFGLVWTLLLTTPLMKRLMGPLTMSARHRVFGWSATAVMAIAVVVMLATSAAG